MIFKWPKYTQTFGGQNSLNLHAIADKLTLTSFQIDAAGDRQVPFAEVAQEAAEGSVVAGQCICMQMV